MTIQTAWRGQFTNDEANRLHAEAFDTRLYTAAAWDWLRLVHAWHQDEMVAHSARRAGIGRALISVAAQRARDAGRETLHVDFEDHLRPFYLDACGFTATNAGLLRLGRPDLVERSIASLDGGGVGEPRSSDPGGI